MTRRNSLFTFLLGTAIVLSVASSQAFAKPKTVTLMQLSDVHGHIAPHAAIFNDPDTMEETLDANSGGMAKLTTLIKDVRDEVGEENSLLLLVGDTTHGSAETLFSQGEVIMPMLNALDIDAFLPGNWDFGYGPRVYRQRFTPAKPPLAPNNRTTIAWMDGKPGHEGQECNTPGGLIPYDKCHVTRANFPAVAINLYNYNEVAGVRGPLVHPRYVIKDVGDIKVGIIGITSDVVPQQAQAFNTGFRFTMGWQELPDAIADATAEGANLIVVLSELGLAKNVQMVKEFPEIDVMFSGHTHERTPEAIVIDHGKGDISIVTEAGEDDFLGRLDVKVAPGSGKIIDWNWALVRADSSVEEDPAMKALVDRERDTFVGDNATCHTFGINAFPFGKGHTLCDPLDTWVGHTDPTIERFNVLEDISNNAMVDGFVDLARFVDPSLDDTNSLSTTNGFRFDVTILGSDDGFSGDITIGDLYTYYPIGPGLALAEFSGGRLMDHWEGILNNVFDPNAFRQRGGWFLGYTANMHFEIELNEDFPISISDGRRIRSATINGVKVDRSKTYTLASCYPHGNPVDEVCRTSGASNVRFIVGDQENCANPDLHGNCQIDVSAGAGYTIEGPVNDADIWDPVRFADGGPLFLRVAPFNFVHPMDALRRYLPNNPITTAAFGLGRVNGICESEFGCTPEGAPHSEYGGPGIVQATQGAGPSWEKRIIAP